MSGNKSEINVVYGKFHISFFVRGAMAADILLKEMVLQERVVMSNLKSLPQSVQSLVRLFSRQ